MTPGFLVNDRVMLDAGTISAALSIEAQSRITDIFISHTHLDHIKGLLFVADNIIGRIKQPVNIRAIPKVIDAIKKHLMNGLIWPDFTEIPTRKDPVLAYKPFAAGKIISLAGLSGHFTPAQLHQDLTKARVANSVPIFIYHIKPVHKKRVIKELRALGRKNVKILQEGKTYTF